jgi:DNA-directed RNA polymerase specialized sigma24 family protein
MTQDQRPGDEHGQDELIAAFAALGGPLTGDELRRLLRSGKYDGSVVRLATLLLAGDTAAAEQVARDSVAAVQHAWDRLEDDPGRALAYLRREVVNGARAVRRHQATGGDGTSHAGPDPPGAGHAAVRVADREPWVRALGALPVRQREAVVLCHCLGLCARQAAEAMRISTGAVGSHLVRGMSSLRRTPRPE